MNLPTQHGPQPHPDQGPAGTGPAQRPPLWAGWLALCVGTLAVYWPVAGFAFLNFDDNVYITGNPHVQAGLTWAGVNWAMRAVVAANWHPVTCLSHMLDCQLYGPKAGGHHVTSLLLHIGNSCLLFTLLARTTGRRGASFVIAACFAWHPLHVESVAWVAERKDVLSTCFGLLSLLAYHKYVTRVGCRVSGLRYQPSSSAAWYLLALLCFALSLMSKPMLVTLPFVMLLLDYWPLGRLQPGPPPSRLKRVASLLGEKAPFLLLAALSCGLTLWAQNKGGAVTTVKDLPLALRLVNAVLSYCLYIGKTLWPAGLAAFYPYPRPHLSWWIWPAAGSLLAVSATVLRLRRFPYLAVGWLWYLGTLVPVIGLVQVGAQAMADRYSYVPAIGLFWMLVFGCRDLGHRLRVGGSTQALGAALALGACLLLTARQVGFWRSSEALYRHALEVTRYNFVAYNNLGTALELQGDRQEAIGCYQKALYWKPDYADAHCNLGQAYADAGRPREAILELETALRLNPEQVRAHYSLANAFLAAGDSAAAAVHYQAALVSEPGFAVGHFRLGAALAAQGEFQEATRQYQEAVRLQPQWVLALNNLAWLLATRPEAQFRDGPQAVAVALRAVALTGTNQAPTLDTLGAALAEAGRFPEAIQMAQLAARLVPAADTNGLGAQIQEHLQCYLRGAPVRELSLLNPTSANNQ